MLTSTAFTSCHSTVNSRFMVPARSSSRVTSPISSRLRLACAIAARAVRWSSGASSMAQGLALQRLHPVEQGIRTGGPLSVPGKSQQGG